MRRCGNLFFERTDGKEYMNTEEYLYYLCCEFLNKEKYSDIDGLYLKMHHIMGGAIKASNFRNRFVPNNFAYSDHNDMYSLYEFQRNNLEKSASLMTDYLQIADLEKEMLKMNIQMRANRKDSILPFVYRLYTNISSTNDDYIKAKLFVSLEEQDVNVEKVKDAISNIHPSQHSRAINELFDPIITDILQSLGINTVKELMDYNSETLAQLYSADFDINLNKLRSLSKEFVPAPVIIPVQETSETIEESSESTENNNDDEIAINDIYTLKLLGSLFSNRVVSIKAINGTSLYRDLKAISQSSGYSSISALLNALGYTVSDKSNEHIQLQFNRTYEANEAEDNAAEEALIPFKHRNISIHPSVVLASINETAATTETKDSDREEDITSYFFEVEEDKPAKDEEETVYKEDDIAEESITPVESLTNSEDKRLISHVFADRKYLMFVNYCSSKGLIYMDQLVGFDFYQLLGIAGIGRGKVKAYIEKYEADKKPGLTPAIQIAPIIQDLSANTLNDNGLFKSVNDEFQNVSISILGLFDIKEAAITSFIQKGYQTIGSIKNISKNYLSTFLTKRNLDILETIQSRFESSVLDFTQEYLNEHYDTQEYKYALMRANKYTLQEIGDAIGVSRERIRQVVASFMAELSLLFEPLLDSFTSKKEFVSSQEVIDLFTDEKHGHLLLYWCKEFSKLHYLDYADLFLPASYDVQSLNKKLDAITNELFVDGASISEVSDDLEDMLLENGITFLSNESFINRLFANGYKLYGDFVFQGRQSYGYLCSKIVANKFPDGIKLYDSEDLKKIREYAAEIYGDIGINENDRALSVRLSDYLVLCDRGKMTAEENVMVDPAIMDEIKEYIDHIPSSVVYYSELFARFENKLISTGNVDNYDFLHGVLKLYYPNEYDFTNRDYLTKKGNNYDSLKLGDKIYDRIMEVGRPLSKEEIRSLVPGLTLIRLFSTIYADNRLLLWDYNKYTSKDLLDLSSGKQYQLKKYIEAILENNEGYCSEAILFNEISENHPEIISNCGIENPRNLYYMCMYLFNKDFEFSKPHICKKGVFEEATTEKILIQLIGNKDQITLSELRSISNKNKWANATFEQVFNTIKDDYMRVSDNLYISNRTIDITQEQIDEIEIALTKLIGNSYIALKDENIYTHLPHILYEWNGFILQSIIESLIPSIKIIEPMDKNRRYVKAIAVRDDSTIKSFADLVVSLLQQDGITTISEHKLLNYLQNKNLAYKSLPADLSYDSRFVEKNEIYHIESPVVDNHDETPIEQTQQIIRYYSQTQNDTNEDEVVDRIEKLLNHYKAGLKAKRIATALRMDKKEINSILYSNLDKFVVNDDYIWKNKK